MTDRICVAQIGAAHGIRGEVRLRSFTADPASVIAYGPLESEDGSRRFTVEAMRPAKDVFVAQLQGVTDRNAAEALTHLKLYVPRALLPPPEDGEFYHADLVGLSAVSPNGDALGTVKAIHNFGAGDLIEIAPTDGSPPLMLPFTDVTVPAVDLAAENDHRRTAAGDRVSVMWRASVLTIFPEMFPGPLGLSLAGKALDAGLWGLDAIDIRDHATDKHRTVDDTPASGGPGMVMKADVLARALDSIAADDRSRLLMSPRGRPLTQDRVVALARGPGLVVLCGRFEGIDERLIAARGLTEVSIGDFVLSGGEIAALALIDACVRLIPGVMGKEASGADESFTDGLLEYPQYTRPAVFEGRPIPDVLTGGDHAKVKAWRRAEAERLTRERRPDLWAAYLAAKGGGGPSKG